jgi:PPM family protein phosphatase
MIRLDRGHFQVAALSHPGMSGKNNEDRFAVSAFQTDARDPTPALFAVLADGIGGHHAGEIAAEMAVNSISQQIAESDGRNPLQVMETAIQAAGRKIHEEAQETSDRRGMGATCACTWIVGNRLYTATVGDSRIYLVRGLHIQQISTDHTWIQEALERGFIKPNDIHGHPNAHVIRRYLGSAAPTQPDFRMRLEAEENDEQALANQGLALMPGDIILLCSDGLTDLVSDHEILAILQSRTQPIPQPKISPGPDARNLEVSVKLLVDLACQRGGIDNITIIALRAPSLPIRQKAAERKPSWRHKLLVSSLGLAGALALGAVLLLGIRWWLNQPVRAGTLSTPSPRATLSSANETTLASPLPSATLWQTPTPTQNRAPAGPTLTPWPTHTRSATTPTQRQ